MENMWGISVVERLYDRLIAFDSATNGAAQLVYKSYIRTLKISKLREIIATGGMQVNQLQQYVEMMRRYQGIEGITLIDRKMISLHKLVQELRSLVSLMHLFTLASKSPARCKFRSSDCLVNLLPV